MTISGPRSEQKIGMNFPDFQSRGRSPRKAWCRLHAPVVVLRLAETQLILYYGAKWRSYTPVGVVRG
jgi:hypothetical protein